MVQDPGVRVRHWGSIIIIILITVTIIITITITSIASITTTYPILRV